VCTIEAFADGAAAPATVLAVAQPSRFAGAAARPLAEVTAERDRVPKLDHHAASPAKPSGLL
jgi:hypothetical protein